MKKQFNVVAVYADGRGMTTTNFKGTRKEAFEYALTTEYKDNPVISVTVIEANRGSGEE